MHCQNCGQFNTQQSNFCRFCGTKFSAAQYQVSQSPMPNPAPVNFENAQRRPYSWKTDEYQIPEDKASKGKTINRVQPLANFQPPVNAAVQPYQQPGAVSHGFNCPRCHSQLYPRIVRQISTAGWIVFATLLVMFFPLFWVGFLIKEDVRVCPVCNFKYN